MPTRKSPAQRLAVEIDHLGAPEALGELAQDCFQGPRIQGPQDRAEGVVAGNAMFQIQEPPERVLPRQGKLLEIGARCGARQGRGQGDEGISSRSWRVLSGPGGLRAGETGV